MACIISLCVSCIGQDHDKIIEDCKYVFNKEKFNALTTENVIGISSLFQTVWDSIYSFVPLNLKEGSWTKVSEKKREVIYYEYMNECVSFKCHSSYY